MKTKLLFGILISFLLLSATALAGFFPQPVAGIVKIGDYPAPEDMKIVMKNLRTNVEMVAKVDSNGFFLVDLANYGYADGDKIEIALEICKSQPECKKIITITDGVPNAQEEVSFLLAKEGSASEVIINNVFTYVCWDNSQVAVASQCPVQPVPPTPPVVIKIFCEDGTQVENESLCDDSISGLWGYIIGALAVTLSALGFGWSKGFMGLCKYYWKKGEEADKNGDYESAVKYKQRAIKMAKTAFKKAVAEEYKEKVEEEYDY